MPPPWQIIELGIKGNISQIKAIAIATATAVTTGYGGGKAKGGSDNRGESGVNLKSLNPLPLAAP